MLRMVNTLEMGDLGPLGISKPVGPSSSPRWPLHLLPTPSLDAHCSHCMCAGVPISARDEAVWLPPTSVGCCWAPSHNPHDVDPGVKPHPKDQMSYPRPPACLLKHTNETRSCTLCLLHHYVASWPLQHEIPTPEIPRSPCSSPPTSHQSSLVLVGQSHYGRHH